ncbi:MAG: hypothetical protein DRQ51_04610 [Gammaproteobacteria bacterium]|nr:MAG: hypothetical protein DRQ51_04610 [Gammaproteobacteria bacterium]
MKNIFVLIVFSFSTKLCFAFDSENLRLFTTFEQRVDLEKKRIEVPSAVINSAPKVVKKRKPKIKGYVRREDKNLSTIWLEQKNKNKTQSQNVVAPVVTPSTINNNNNLPNPQSVARDKQWIMMLNGEQIKLKDEQEKRR